MTDKLDAALSRYRDHTAAPDTNAAPGTVPTWDTETVHTRDYYPTRLEYFAKDIIAGEIAHAAPKDKKGAITRGLELALLAMKAVDEAQD